MYTRFSSFLSVAALVAVATAAPDALRARTSSSSSSCDTGSMQCCASTETSNPTTLTALSSLVGIALPSIDGLIGVSCTPITVIGTGSGADCTQQPVCCTDNNFNGLVSLGCTPVNLNL